jgi:hypothetical protein
MRVELSYLRTALPSQHKHFGRAHGMRHSIQSYSSPKEPLCFHLIAFYAFDIYRTVAMMTSSEREEAVQMRGRYTATEPVAEAGRVVKELFMTREEVRPASPLLYGAPRFAFYSSQQ